MQYNETINNILETGELDKREHEVARDKTSARVTVANVVPLHSANQVQSLLSLAKSRRVVAATFMKYVANPDLFPAFPTVFLPVPLANAHVARIRFLLFGC